MFEHRVSSCCYLGKLQNFYVVETCWKKRFGDWLCGLTTRPCSLLTVSWVRCHVTIRPPCLSQLCLPHHDRRYPSDCNVCRTFLSYSALVRMLEPRNREMTTVGTGEDQEDRNLRCRYAPSKLSLPGQISFLWKRRVRWAKFWNSCPHQVEKALVSWGADPLASVWCFSMGRVVAVVWKPLLNSAQPSVISSSKCFVHLCKSVSCPSTLLIKMS